jgi:hypothetical protein
MRKSVAKAFAGLIFVGAITGTASAAVVTRTYSFAASNFFATAEPPPVVPVTGAFTMTFDDAANIFDAPGAVINALNIPVDSPILFTYETGPFSFVRFGGAANGTGSLATNTNDILFQYSPTFGSVLLYSSTLTPMTNFFSTTVDVTVTNGNAAVPEPATWALMIAGFGLVGTGMRRRARDAALRVGSLAR